MAFWKKDYAPADIAEAVFHARVRSMIVEPPTGLALNAQQAERFKARASIFQLGAVILAFANEEKRSKKAAAARVVFVNSLFGLPNPDQSQQQLFEVSGEAFESMRQLIGVGKNAGGSMKWGCDWLEQVGVENPNPMHAFALALAWTDFFIDTTTGLRKFT